MIIYNTTGANTLRSSSKRHRISNRIKGHPDGYCDLFLSEKRQFLGNIQACHRRVSHGDLKRWLLTRTRFDLEEAAALVVSAMVTSGHWDCARRLIKEMTGILTSSNMWIEDDVKLPCSDTTNLALQHLFEKIPVWFEKNKATVETPQSLSDLVTILLRVRRSAPRDRCLYIPDWMFKESGMQQPEHIRNFVRPENPIGAFPSLQPTDNNTIFLSRKTFRSLQKYIFRLYKFWKAECRLRRNIKLLEKEVLYPTDWIEQYALHSGNIVQLSDTFFRCQRRLQKKVVSNFGWSQFLDKGEGKNLYQNNLKLQSTFEQVLRDILVQEIGEIKDDSFENIGTIMRLIDRTCILMREYVNVFGDGQKDNLVFKLSQNGGSGRGPVDDYNLLCDVLSELKRQAGDVGVTQLPGPVHKLLAKDIMHWNNSWADDAFANGKIPFLGGKRGLQVDLVGRRERPIFVYFS